MIHKTLLVDPAKCTGCRTCEMACSLRHEAKCSPLLSRTRVIKFEAKGLNFPTVCAHCSKPHCMTACTQGAIRVDEETGAVVINEALCSGCRACLTACPHGQVGFHPEKRVAFKCDLCGGDPNCARQCPTGAIKYSGVDQFLMARRRALLARSIEA
ncbi:MAG: 4Fe-4S dicluster domain-containing protein [Pelotomaculum sp.]|uniref:Fe-S-cluster-containing hydrogenase components 2 n=1 Tax=Pelotomaculum thermopropionicum (strain DSM 13744 / JCM 10971 / SI) TaxID=370438 RepID=A5D4P3_PELTS|nr:4Fe-4S dicluster domain-containing protein [Pelotomaculum sp.]BAF58790.1 Fe-S-cluster-containing hydrogenase components 2 [Pelotomaculum thermopropionicum SI]